MKFNDDKTGHDKIRQDKDNRRSLKMTTVVAGLID